MQTLPRNPQQKQKQQQQPHYYYHVETLFAELERNTRNPVKLYRHLLQRAVTQLDSVITEKEQLQAEVQYLQWDRREEKKRREKLQEELQTLKRKRRIKERYVDHTHSQTRKERRKQGRNDTLSSYPLTTATPSLASSISLSTSNNKYGWTEKSDPIGPNMRKEGENERENDTNRNSKKKQTCVDERGHSSAGLSCTTVPIPSTTTTTSSSLLQSRTDRNNNNNNNNSNNQNSDITTCMEKDNLTMERVLGDLLLFVMNTDSVNNDTNINPKTYKLHGNASSLCEAVISSIRILKKREVSLRNRVKLLEETVKRNEELRLDTRMTAEHQARLEMLKRYQNDMTSPLISAMVTLPVKDNNNNNNNNMDDDNDNTSDDSDSDSNSDISDSGISGIADIIHPSSATYSTRSSFSTHIYHCDTVNNNNNNNNSNKEEECTSTLEMLCAEKKSGGVYNSEDKPLNDLVGEVEFMEYMNWKQEFLQELVDKD